MFDRFYFVSINTYVYYNFALYYLQSLHWMISTCILIVNLIFSDDFEKPGTKEELEGAESAYFPYPYYYYPYVYKYPVILYGK